MVVFHFQLWMQVEIPSESRVSYNLGEPSKLIYSALAWQRLVPPTVTAIAAQVKFMFAAQPTGIIMG
jgi:hypothetical protein